MDLKRPEGWEAALAQRNRLLEYDKTRFFLIQISIYKMKI